MFSFKKRFINLLIRHNIIAKEHFEFLSKDPFNKGNKNKISRHEFLYSAFYLMNTNKISGDYAEFGCFGCMTFSLAYKEALRQGLDMRFWAFDSFEGLPAPKEKKDLHPSFPKGAMSMSIDEFIIKCEQNNIPRDIYEIIPGFYDQSLKEENDLSLPTDISIAYIDCDLYSSTMDVLKFLYPRLKHGMIIAFDDYFMYTSKEISGNRNAMLEVFTDALPFKLLPYMQFSHVGQSFIVEDKRLIEKE